MQHWSMEDRHLILQGSTAHCWAHSEDRIPIPYSAFDFIKLKFNRSLVKERSFDYLYFNVAQLLLIYRTQELTERDILSTLLASTVSSAAKHIRRNHNKKIVIKIF